MACHVSVPYVKKKNVPMDELVTRKTSNNNAENVYMHKSVVIMGEC